MGLTHTALNKLLVGGAPQRVHRGVEALLHDRVEAVLAANAAEVAAHLLHAAQSLRHCNCDRKRWAQLARVAGGVRHTPQGKQ